MAERPKAAVLKTVIPSDRDRGFESHSLLQSTRIHAFRLGTLRLASHFWQNVEGPGFATFFISYSTHHAIY